MVQGDWGGFPEVAKVKRIGKTTCLWGKVIFGFCGELWCFVVGLRFLLGYSSVALASTGFAALIFARKTWRDRGELRG
jgi:hypothetical protein